jgi:hypothetical protein
LPSLNAASSRDQINDQDNDRDYEEQMDESAERVRAHEAEQPEHQKNNEDSPKHMFSFELVYFASFAEVGSRSKIFKILLLVPRAAPFMEF